jgi:NADH-quinone oxidoreductase subunit L
VTAGFYSKDMILWQVWTSDKGNFWLFSFGLIGAFLTAVYTFRMFFLTFAGNGTVKVTRRPGFLVTIPLIILAALSLVGGFMEIPGNFGNSPFLSTFLNTALPPLTAVAGFGKEGNLQFITSLLAVIGIMFGYRVFLHSPQHTGSSERSTRGPIFTAVCCFLYQGWNFDLLYEKAFVRPFLWIAHGNRDDFIDLFYSGIALLFRFFNRLLVFSQSGKVRRYAMGIAIGAVILIGVVELL